MSGQVNRILGLPLICLAMFSLAGGHWAVLQTVAWAGMIREYSKDAPLAQAIDKTFDGRYPCAMCKKIAEGQKKESKAPATIKVAKKSEVFVRPMTAGLRPPQGREFQYLPVAELAGPARADEPPGPVPRAERLIAA